MPSRSRRPSPVRPSVAASSVAASPTSPSGRKSATQPAIFSITAAREPDGRRSATRASIFFALAPRGTGRKAVLALAEQQRGLVNDEQLRAAGLARGAVRGMLRSGSLHRVYNRVHSVGSPVWRRFGPETAACLNFGHDLALSHRSGVELWGLREPSDGPVTLSVIGRGLRSRDGLRLHRLAALDIRDVRLRHGLPVTAPARTLLDYAAEASSNELADALGEARARRLVTDDELVAAFERAALRAGSATLRRLLDTPFGAVVTRSRFERRLISLLQDAGLPLPEVNATLHGHEVDFAWRAHRLILETDGWDVHRGRQAFERDRRRDADHAAHGFRTIRITWQQLEREPMSVIAILSAALAIAA